MLIKLSSLFATYKAYLFIGAFAAAMIASGMGSYRFAADRYHAKIARLEKAWAEDKEQAVETAKAETQRICDENNQFTKGKTHELQTELDANRARYYKLLQYGGACSSQPTATGAAGGGHAAAYANVPAVLLSVEDAAGIGLRNDDQAAALMKAQDTLAFIYKQNGQADLLPQGYR